jgi:phosphate transport system permease protein
MILIVGFLVTEALPALTQVGLVRLFTDGTWHPTSPAPTFGILPMVVGTTVVAAGALLLAVPVGVGAALFLGFYAPPWLASGLRRVLELMAGTPSVVFGFWGLVTVVPWIRSHAPPGSSVLAGALVLGLMVLPTVVLLTDAALARVPPDQLRSAATLGLSRRGIAFGVALPAARRGIAVAAILAATRAVGETMVVVMVCGNVVQVPQSLFEPARTLTANIALEMGYATSLHRSVLFASGLLLLAFVLVLLGLAGPRRTQRGTGHV